MAVCVHVAVCESVSCVLKWIDDVRFVVDSRNIRKFEDVGNVTM